MASEPPYLSNPLQAGIVSHMMIYLVWTRSPESDQQSNKTAEIVTKPTSSLLQTLPNQGG